MNFWQKLWAEQPVPEYGDSKRVSAFAKEAREKSEKEKREERQKKAEKASQAAYVKYKEAALKAFEGYKPKGAAFRIVQRPAGHFEIERLRVVVSDRGPWSSWSGAGDIISGYQFYPVEEIEKWSTDPVEIYDVVKNDQAPIKTTEHSYSRYYGETRAERLVGCAPLAFNVFADAEAYLFRMTQPTEVTTEYDFPPLKKRLVKRAKKEPSA